MENENELQTLEEKECGDTTLLGNRFICIDEVNVFDTAQLVSLHQPCRRVYINQQLVGDEDGVKLARSNEPVRQRALNHNVIICGAAHTLLRESIDLENLRVKQVPEPYYETESAYTDCYRGPLTHKQKTKKLLRRKQQTSSRRSNRK